MLSNSLCRATKYSLSFALLESLENIAILRSFLLICMTLKSFEKISRLAYQGTWTLSLFLASHSRVLLEILSLTDACAFEELFTHSTSRRELITTFLALLEMIRLKLIRVVQSNTFGPIRVYKRSSSQTREQEQEGQANDRRPK